jgi:hypothetical protein
MNMRFHERYVKFDPGLSFPARMSQAKAAELFAQGDKAGRDEIIEGHAWLAGNIAGRVLDKLGLPARLGEDLTGEGLVVIADVVYGMNQCPDNISAYLGTAIENRMVEFLDENSLCPVPGRTKRDRAAKGKPRVDAPKIALATDLAGDDKETNESVLSRVRRSSCPSDVSRVEHLYEYCVDQIDRDIIDLRYIGPVPRAMEEVAELAGVSRGNAEKRLNEIEARVYRDLGKRIPKGERTKGVKLLASRPKSRVKSQPGTEVSAASL